MVLVDLGLGRRGPTKGQFPYASENGPPRSGGSVQRAQETVLVEKVGELSIEFLWRSA